MRYLKVAAQDRARNGKADTVVLNFFRQQPDGPDVMVHEAIAVDISADRRVDVLCSGDINRDGENDVMDKQLLDVFADAFLQLNWFNAGNLWRRTLVICVEHFSKRGTPNAVRMAFHEHAGLPCKDSLVYRAAAYDADGNGVLEPFTNSDVDHDGVANNADKELIRQLCTTFLAFNWYEVNQTSLS